MPLACGIGRSVPAIPDCEAVACPGVTRAGTSRAAATTTTGTTLAVTFRTAAPSFAHSGRTRRTLAKRQSIPWGIGDPGPDQGVSAGQRRKVSATRSLSRLIVRVLVPVQVRTAAADLLGRNICTVAASGSFSVTDSDETDSRVRALG